MIGAARLAVTIVIVLSAWTLLSVYVYSRLRALLAVPAAARRRWLMAVAAALWVSFPLALILGRFAGWASYPLEQSASLLAGVLALLAVYLLAADVLTGFGLAGRRAVRAARRLALGVAAVMSIAALVQGVRAPVIREHEVRVPGLGPENDGLVIVQISDLHLGATLGRRWLEQRIAQVAGLKPDLIAVTGDIVDHDVSLAEPLAPVLRQLKARFGVWAVTGNHEYYAGLDRALKLIERAGIRVLQDTSVQVAPGLVLAGVDDLTARRQFGISGDFVDRALSNRPAGATIYLCHSPWQADRAAALGAGLMLSGHTHAGQIWPITHLVQILYPRVVGRYQVGGMTLIVSRGTGFWGPPMRLFRRAEILKITLRRG